MDVKKKIGPLPAYAWALILGGTIGAVLLVKKGKGTTGTTGEVIPELAAQATPAPSEGGGGAAGSLEAAEAKDASELETLRNQISAQAPANTVSTPGFGAGIGEVIQAREGLEALGLSVGSPQHNTEASADSKSAVKKATGKAAGYPLTSSRGKYRNGTFQGHAAHVYASAVHGGVGPRKNIVVLGGPAKVGHAQRGSHAPAHVSKPPAHHTAPKPASHPATHAPARPAPHATAPAHHEPPKPARKPPPRKRR